MIHFNKIKSFHTCNFQPKDDLNLLQQVYTLWKGASTFLIASSLLHFYRVLLLKFEALSLNAHTRTASQAFETKPNIYKTNASNFCFHEAVHFWHSADTLVESEVVGGPQGLLFANGLLPALSVTASAWEPSVRPSMIRCTLG